MSLETARLSLKPCAPAQLLALIEQPEHFAQQAGFAAAPGLHEMFTSHGVSPQWITALRTTPASDPWRHGFFLLHRATSTVIGTAGFKGPADPEGSVEIAYGIAPDFEGQGYATEAAAALVAFAFDTPGVALVCAHTLPTPNASTRVLRKCGFRYVGDIVDPDDGPVWRWEHGR